jgi:hypothetical protein
MLEELGRKSGRLATSLADAVGRSVRWTGRRSAGALTRLYRLIRPSLLPALQYNRAIKDEDPQSIPPSGGAANLEAAGVLYQTEAARMTGLTTKAAGALAAQALIAAALVTISQPGNVQKAVVCASIVYLVCGLAAAVATQLPRRVWAISVADVEGNDPARAMLNVVRLNRPLASRLCDFERVRYSTCAVCVASRARHWTAEVVRRRSRFDRLPRLPAETLLELAGGVRGLELGRHGVCRRLVPAPTSCDWVSTA